MFENKVLTHNGKVFDSKISSLTFQVSGDRFPIRSAGSRGIFSFVSTDPNNVAIVNWGDGTTTQINFTHPYGGGYQGGLSSENDGFRNFSDSHIFQDGNTDLRTITVNFQNPDAIIEFENNYCYLYGELPLELGYFSNLEVISINRANYLTGFPDSLYQLQDLKEVSLSNISQSLYTKIPDGFFNSEIEEFSVDGTVDLSNPIASNFFKINQWKNSLKSFFAQNCNIVELVDEIAECTLLEDLRISNNKYETFPTQITNLTNLNRLYVGNKNGQFDLTGDTTMPFLNLPNLRHIVIAFTNLDLSDLPTKWQNLTSLENFTGFNGFINTDTRFNEFINQFYTLCTNEANITEDANAFNGEYPHRFRDISWGDASLAFTGTKQAPQGYVQGGNNGTPANEGEKVYVLQNQYGHTITHA